MHGFSRRFVLVVLGAVLAASALGGCGGDELTPEQQLCESLSELDGATAALGELSLGSTRSEVEQTVDDFLTAVQDVAGDVGAVVGSDVDAVQQSFDGFATQLGSLPDDATIAETIAEVQQALPQLQTALDQIVGSVDCSE
jgi:hypothetical protein